MVRRAPVSRAALRRLSRDVRIRHRSTARARAPRRSASSGPWPPSSRCARSSTHSGWLALYRAGRQAEALGAHRDAQLRETREVRALCACRAALSDLAWSPEGRWEAANMGGRNLIGA